MATIVATSLEEEDCVPSVVIGEIQATTVTAKRKRAARSLKRFFISVS